MAADAFSGVIVSSLSDSGQSKPKYEEPVVLKSCYDPNGISITVQSETGRDLFEFPVTRTSEYSKVGKKGYLFEFDYETILFTFKNDTDASNFHKSLGKLQLGKDLSVFTERTEDSSASQYFQFYGYLSQQQNMMQDYIRTSTYQRAILSNLDDFRDKVVLDVGAGSGILSFFAVQSGASKVYAVEASTMAQHAESLAKFNSLEQIQVVAGKIEEIELPEKVDIIISEPMGYMLFNERMLETFLHAKKWLKPGGKMFPSRGDLHIAPFNDETLYMEQFNKANFWYQQSFHGVDLSCLRAAAMKEYFRQPIVDTFDIRICTAKSVRHVVDFHTASESDLHRMDIPLEFHALQSGLVHGLAFWFDVAFFGSSTSVWLSTAPTEPLTHWYQVRCLLETPIFVKQGQLLTGTVLLLANKRQSYDVTIDLRVEGSGLTSSNTLDLKNPYFRYAGQPAQPPPGHSSASPSETYWAQLDVQGARQAVTMVNGMTVNGLGEVSAMSDVTGVNNSNSSLLGLGKQLTHYLILENQVGARGGRPQVANTYPTSQIGGNSYTTTQQLVLGATSHYPLSNSLMIGDYVTPGSVILPSAAHLANMDTFQP
ncbi:histone-arginine methyltransferase CARMER-like isoform X2 [Daphnia pulex]|uniref:histone-arginine methyltransferase CARMER-like isoform X2 n=1 Tax=Daphnia pulex TaxID=6669 RepID=UPI001EDDFA4A|nr:histone-arginine methyltransferase CARMER-like isoform X2 [Daphnia pulex]